MAQQIKRKQETVIYVLVLLVLAFAALVSARYFTRIDLTENGAFTISKTSKNLFTKIDDQVRITYYCSSKIGQVYSEPKQIEDTLYEYAAYSRGKIRISVVDPQKANVVASAEGLGVQPRQMQVVEKDEQSVATVYTGIVIQYLDRYETLPVVFSTETLEYDLTRAILKVVKNTSSVAGILLGDSNKTWENDYKYLAGVLKQGGYAVKETKAGEMIPDDVSVLFVLGNSKLDDFDLYPVDQYVRKGGKALFAVKGVDIMTQYGLNALPVAKDNLFAMLSLYGVDLKKQLVLDKSCRNLPYQVQTSGGGAVTTLARYPHWISLNERYVSHTNPLTSRFAGLDLFWPSPIELKEVEGVKAEAILKTTPQAWKMTSNFALNPNEESSFYIEAPQTTGQYVVGAALAGTFKSYFDGKSLPKRDGVTATWPKPLDSAKESRIVVIGSSDFATDFMQIPSDIFSQKSSTYNASFLANCADWLSSDDDILSIKTRTAKDMKLDKIEEPKARNAAKILTYVVNLGLVPLAVVGFGAWRFLRRKKKEQIAYVPEASNDVSK
jgi:gliding-associated putative ABC transporter substrate-binding component GldG